MREVFSISNDGRKSKKRDDLLITAEKLLLKQGVKQLTVEEIVRQAKVSKATFYKHFSDKHDILKHVLQEIFAQQQTRLTQAVEKARKDRLSQQDFLSIFDINEYEHLFQSEFISELLADYPDLVEMYQSWIAQKRLPLYHELMRMAKIDGLIRMDIDTDFLILYSLSMRTAMSQMLMNNPQVLEKMTMKEFMSKFYDIYLHGVVAAKDEPCNNC